MARNKLSDLRNHLFETIERLKDDQAPMDLDRAKAISQVAQTIIDSAKVEVEMAKVINAQTGSEFFDSPANIERRGALAAGPRELKAIAKAEGA